MSATRTRAYRDGRAGHWTGPVLASARRHPRSGARPLPRCDCCLRQARQPRRRFPSSALSDLFLAHLIYEQPGFGACVSGKRGEYLLNSVCAGLLLIVVSGSTTPVLAQTEAGGGASAPADRQHHVGARGLHHRPD